MPFSGFVELFSFINSRCFKSEQTDSNCVIPLMDKISFHHSVANCRPMFTTEGFSLIATEDIARNQELVIMSGERSKSSTFSDTGETMALSDVMMTFAFDHDDPFAEQKLGYIEGAKNPVTSFVPKDLNAIAELLAFLRLKHYHPADMGDLQACYNNWGLFLKKQGTQSYQVFMAQHIVPPICFENELQVFACLKQSALEQLEMYPTTLEQDLAILKQDSLADWQRSCVEQRSAEKDVLHFLIELADFVPTVVTLKSKDARKAVQSLPKRLEDARPYLQEQLL